MFSFSGIFGWLINALAPCLWLGGATNKQGAKNSNTGTTKAFNLSDTYGGNANSLFSSLEPQLEAEARNPSGYGAPGLAAMDTAAGEAAAGSTAGSVGAMRRAAARTRNAGGYAAAEDEAARSGQRTASTAALDIAGKNEELKQQQKQSALSGLQGLYGTDVGASISSLGLAPNMINAGTNASKYQASPFMNFMGQLGDLAADAGKAAGPGGLAGL